MVTKVKKKAKPRSAKKAQAQEEPGEATVTILREGRAEKLSPRGEGRLTYQVGRLGDAVYLRISANESSGRFSREWVEVSALRNSLAQLPKDAGEFKGAAALRSAWKGQSACNGGFGAAVLKAEGVFAAHDDPKKKGMLRLAGPGALDEWEKSVLAMDVPEGAEQVPLNPPKPKPPFQKKAEESEEKTTEDEGDGEDGDEAGSET